VVRRYSALAELQGTSLMSERSQNTSSKRKCRAMKTKDRHRSRCRVVWAMITKSLTYQRMGSLLQYQSSVVFSPYQECWSELCIHSTDLWNATLDSISTSYPRRRTHYASARCDRIPALGSRPSPLAQAEARNGNMATSPRADLPRCTATRSFFMSKRRKIG
jgi:hypothetical protein